jgi:hypothetical protein
VGSVDAWHRLQRLTFVAVNDACRSGHGRHGQGQPRVARSAADEDVRAMSIAAIYAPARGTRAVVT